MGLVYLPTYIYHNFTIKNQPNVAKYTSHMDAMRKDVVGFGIILQLAYTLDLPSPLPTNEKRATGCWGFVGDEILPSLYMGTSQLSQVNA